jgi:DNA-binding LacI/PurR family transcriptional regulator
MLEMPIVAGAGGGVGASTVASALVAADAGRYRAGQPMHVLVCRLTMACGAENRVAADLANAFFARLADRVVWEARARGINAVPLTNQEDPHPGGRVAGDARRTVGRLVIATPTGGNAEKWRRLISLGVNVVFVDREIDELPGVDPVAINNELSRGSDDHAPARPPRTDRVHSGRGRPSAAGDRVAGFQRAMAAAGVDVDEQLIHTTRSAEMQAVAR